MSEKEDLNLLKKTFEDFIKTSSELQHSYETLKERSGRLSLFLSNILDNINSSILVIDNKNKLILWNNLSTEFFPVLAGKDPPIDIDMINKNKGIDLSEVIADKRDVIEIETIVSNELKWFEVQSTDFINSKKEKIGYIVLINDKTELKQLQIRSQQEDRLRVMGELAAEVAHEIRNPLGSIELMVSLLQDDMESDTKQSDILKRIRSSVNNMNHTVTNILLFTRDIKIKRSVFSIIDLFEESKNILMMTLTKKAINLDIKADKAIISGDFELLKQSIGNILINAAEAVNMNGKIFLSSKIKNEQLIIKIKDNGSGIPIEVYDKVFNPFFTTKNTGTGLGLAMVKRIIEAHKGSIEFESNEKGTLFKVKIPIK